MLIAFLIAAYAADVRYFELLDMLNKLFLSSILFFFPMDAQLPIGMVWCILFLGLLLLLQPYVRNSDGELRRLFLRRACLTAVLSFSACFSVQT